MRVNYQVSVDCADPHLLARFWSQALGWTVEDHTDRIKQLMEQGHVTENDVVTIDGRLAFKEAAAVRDPEAKVASDGLPERGRMLFQVVPEGKRDELRTDVGLPCRLAHGRSCDVMAGQRPDRQCGGWQPAMIPQAGGTLHIGRDASVQFARPITFRVIRCRTGQPTTVRCGWTAISSTRLETPNNAETSSSWRPPTPPTHLPPLIGWGQIRLSRRFIAFAGGAT